MKTSIALFAILVGTSSSVFADPAPSPLPGVSFSAMGITAPCLIVTTEAGDNAAGAIGSIKGLIDEATSDDDREGGPSIDDLNDDGTCRKLPAKPTISMACPKGPNTVDELEKAGIKIPDQCPFNGKVAAQMKKKLAKIACAAECKQKKGEAIRDELACLSLANQQMNGNIGKAKDALANLLTQGGQQIDTYTADIADLAGPDGKGGMLGELNARLNGDPDTKKPGLLQVRDSLKKIQGQIGTKAQQYITQGKQIKQADANYPQFKENYLFSETMKCFQNQAIGLKCGGQTNLSGLAYLQCMVAQSQMSASSSSQKKQKADTYAQQQVGDLFSKTIQAQVPHDVAFPKDMKELSDTMLQSFTIDTKADLLSAYASTFSALSKSTRLNVSGIVDTAVSYCQSQVQTTNAAKIKAMDDAITASKDGFKTAIDTDLQAVTGDYAEFIQGAQDITFTPNASNCTNTSGSEGANTVEAQSLCMQAMSIAVSTLLNGQVQTTDNDTKAAITRLFGASVPPFAFKQDYATPSKRYTATVDCKGITDCVNQLQVGMQKTKTALTTAQSNKTKVQSSVNNQVTATTAAVAKEFSRVSSALRKQLGAVNKALGSIGVASSDLVKFDPKSESVKDIEKGEKGIYSIDQIEALARAQTKPAIPDPDEGSLEKAQGLAAFSELETLLAKVDGLSGDIQAKADACGDKAKKESFTENCDYVRKLCDGDSDIVSKFKKLAADASGQKRLPGEDDVDDSTLTNGVQGLCSKDKLLACIQGYDASIKDLDDPSGKKGLFGADRVGSSD